MTSLLATALAAGGALLILVLLSLHEARLRAHAADPTPELETAPEVFPLDFEDAPEPGSELCITASRARCTCGRARELHGLRADPGCRRFEYAGGLAATLSREPVEAR